MSLKDFIFINKLIVYLTKFIYDAFTVRFYVHLVLVEDALSLILPSNQKLLFLVIRFTF